MHDVNLVKIENNFNNKNLFSFLNPKNWFRKKYSKDNVNILFIDDQDMPIVDNLRKAGYKVKKIRDVKNTDDSDVKCSQIIFVDYKGVGKNISQTYEGLGLIKELIEQYLDKKRVVLYSAHNNFPNNIVLNEIFDKAHNRISKNADTSEFIRLIETEIENL